MANPDWQQNNDNFVIAGGTYIMIYMPYYFFKKKMSSEIKAGYKGSKILIICTLTNILFRFFFG